MRTGATIVLRALQRHPGIERLDQVPRMRRLRGMSPQLVTDAIDDLVAEGAIEESAVGRLVVRGREEP